MTKFTTTALTPAATTKFAAELADGSKGHVLHSALGITGTWTPVITFATPGDLAVTYSVQLGRYERLGNYVTLYYTLGTSAFTHTTASGALQITGSPFTAVAATGDRHVGPAIWAGITKASYTQACTSLNENSAILGLLASGSGQSANAVQVGDVPTGGTLLLRGNIRFPVQ